MNENEAQSAPANSQPLSRKKKLIFGGVLLLINLLILAGVYVGSIAWRCRQYAEKHSRWIGSPYLPHPQLGYFPNPHHIAYHALEHGERVPVLFNEHGFRIPIDEERSSATIPDRKILFLGCSFTHGYGVPAEKTFAYLSSRELGAEALNAGGSGWGLAHMVLRARQEIPRVKPAWVVVQYSSWLVDRSMNFYGPTGWGKSPAPYIYPDNQKLRIHDPVFRSGNFNLPISDYARKGRLAFIWHVGLPLFAYDDFHVLKTWLRCRLGLLPLPTQNRAAVIDFAYSEIFRLCQEQGANMLIVKIPNNYADHPCRDELPAVGCPSVDTYPALLDSLPVPSNETWRKEYCFWRGSPPALVDTHPNQKAHEVIAQTIISAIRASDTRN